MKAVDLLRRDIVQYIYDQGWPALRPIQEAAVQQVHTSDNNLILAAPTASGKTEAAFLPAINSVADWSSGLKIVYVSPLIALINDQFQRISELCAYLDIPVTSWHGESSRAGKRQLLRQPRGILLITPESIEAMLTRRPGEAEQLFAHTEWVIVDELHSFLETTRGVHVKSLLGRTANLAKQPPRYIGMTATLNRESYVEAKRYFASTRETSVLLDKTRNALTTTINYDKSETPRTPAGIIDSIFDYSSRESMLVFPNARSRVEEIAVGLKRRGDRAKNDVRYFAHHASVDKELRLEAEAFAKTSQYKLFTICCTSTLELGIDIGSVDSVAQVEAAPSVASLAQRLGRSGRQQQHSILHLYASKDWSLLQSLAALELYQDGTIECVSPISKPYGVLVQQILSVLLQYSGLTQRQLVHTLAALDAWGDINGEAIDAVIDHLISIDFIEDVDGVLVTGMSAERTVQSRDFYAHFDAKAEFAIINDHEHIGEMPLSTETIVGANIFLAARIWKIIDIDLSGKKMRVRPASDGKPPIFGGAGGDISHLVRRRMLALLQDTPLSAKRYDPDVHEALRELATENLTATGADFLIKPTSSQTQTIMTFAGSRINRTLLLFLQIIRQGDDKLADFKLNDFSSSITSPHLTSYIDQLHHQHPNTHDIAQWLTSHQEFTNNLLLGGKYLQLLPRELQIDYLVSNHFDIPGTITFLHEH
jgi:ATP-dependent Lhr-like helicase